MVAEELLGTLKKCFGASYQSAVADFPDGAIQHHRLLDRVESIFNNLTFGKREQMCDDDLIDVKMNQNMSSDEVQGKREAAKRWANHVNADPSVQTARGAWEELKGLGGH